MKIHKNFFPVDIYFFFQNFEFFQQFSSLSHRQWFHRIRACLYLLWIWIWSKSSGRTYFLFIFIYFRDLLHKTTFCGSLTALIYYCANFLKFKVPIFLSSLWHKNTFYSKYFLLCTSRFYIALIIFSFLFDFISVVFFDRKNTFHESSLKKKK